MIRAWPARVLAVPALLLAVGCGASDDQSVGLVGAAADPGETAVPPLGFSEGPAGPDPAEDDAQDDVTTPSPDTTADPATGTEMSRPDYSYRAPEGWIDITKQMKESGEDIDSAVGEDLSGVTSVRENLNVVITPAPLLGIDDYESIAPASLKFMVEDLEIFPRVTIDGVEAVHVGGVATTGEASFYFEQFAAKVDGNIYAVSFAVDSGRSEADRRALVDSVLASWEWPG